MNQIINQTLQGAISSRFAPQANQQTNDLAAGITGGYGLIGYKGKVWSIRYRGVDTPLMRDDGDGPRGSIDVVILKASKNLSKIFYENGYVEGSNAPPDCSSANGVVPDQGVPKPQNNICATCPRNQWGTAAGGGKGKACGDSRRLAVVPLTDLHNEAWGGPLLLRVPASSLQDLASFGQKMDQMGFPYYALGVKIGFDSAESYPKFTFNPIRPVSDPEADVIIHWQQSPEVKRIIAEEVDAALLAQATAAPAIAPPVQQVPQQVINGTPPAAFGQPQQPIQQAPVQPVQQPVYQQPVHQPTPAPVQQQPQVQSTGFGPAPVVQGQQPATVQQPQVQAAPPVQQPAPVATQQPPMGAPEAVAPRAPVMTGFGPAPVAHPEQPAGAPPVLGTPAAFGAPNGQSFPDAANGTVMPGPAQPAANTEFADSLDDRLAKLMAQ